MVEPVEALRLSDWVIAGCTLLGPVLAVQAQKWVEGFREKKARRLKSLPIEITGAPGATSLQTILAEKLVKAYNEDGSLKVSVINGQIS